jgi:hypothetical protein
MGLGDVAHFAGKNPAGTLALLPGVHFCSSYE